MLACESIRVVSRCVDFPLVGACGNQHYAHRAATQIGDIVVLKARPLAGSSVLASNNPLFGITFDCTASSLVLGLWGADTFGDQVFAESAPLIFYPGVGARLPSVRSRLRYSACSRRAESLQVRKGRSAYLETVAAKYQSGAQTLLIVGSRETVLPATRPTLAAGRVKAACGPHPA